jgi:hypothetical protein
LQKFVQAAARASQLARSLHLTSRGATNGPTAPHLEVKKMEGHDIQASVAGVMVKAANKIVESAPDEGVLSRAAVHAASGLERAGQRLRDGDIDVSPSAGVGAILFGGALCGLVVLIAKGLDARRRARGEPLGMSLPPRDGGFALNRSRDEVNPM